MSDDYGDGKWCKSLRVTSPQLEKGAVGVDSEDIVNAPGFALVKQDPPTLTLLLLVVKNYRS
ncbi:hypothetical protein F441_15865 [Phytophthora nicotianae CJ01A1]|uniref:Uncharacterized protein n=1 Tax=Phytophthora nicotianae CJ01A1 TaxID=1317063 RepID=W2WC59_PHYNI|nr:hypothetical protein F441_15865 [Phytophthora nicotianae CJ01A1]